MKEHTYLHTYTGICDTYIVNPRHAWAAQGVTVVCLFVCLLVTSAHALWVVMYS